MKQQRNYSFLGLKKAIIPTLDSVSVDLITKYQGKLERP